MSQETITSVTTLVPLERYEASDFLFAPSIDLVEDIVRYAGLSSGLANLRDCIKQQVEDVLAESGADRTKALKDLKQQVIAAGLDPRRASEVFIELGFRERAKKRTSKSKAEKDERLEPVIAKLIALAEAEAGDEAAVALRRAWLSKQAKNQAVAA